MYVDLFHIHVVQSCRYARKHSQSKARFARFWLAVFDYFEGEG